MIFSRLIGILEWPTIDGLWDGLGNSHGFQELRVLVQSNSKTFATEMVQSHLCFTVLLSITTVRENQCPDFNALSETRLRCNLGRDCDMRSKLRHAVL